MTITFGKFCDILSESQENLKSFEVIRAGTNLRKKDCGDFWDDFINLCGNAESMSELLDVPKEKITKWSGNINKIREQVKMLDSDQSKTKNKVIKTGDLK